MSFLVSRIWVYDAPPVETCDIMLSVSVQDLQVYCVAVELRTCSGRRYSVCASLFGTFAFATCILLGLLCKEPQKRKTKEKKVIGINPISRNKKA